MARAPRKLSYDMIKAEKHYIPLHIAPFLIDAARMAVLLSVSPSYIRQLDNAGGLPQAVKLGTRKLWRTSEIESWANAGCPDRIAWSMIKQNNANR